LLSGIALCSTCGSVVKSSGAGDPTKGTRHTVYRCRAAALQPGQRGHASRDAVRVDSYVGEQVLQRLESNALEILQRLHSGNQDSADLHDQKTGLEARLSEAAQLFSSGAITGPQLQEITGSVRNQIDSIDAQLARSVSSSHLAELVSSGDITRRWSRMSLDHRAEIVRAVATVRIMPGRGRVPGGEYFNVNLVDIDWI
jgi:hypothetical protein